MCFTHIIACFNLSWLINGGAEGAQLLNDIDSSSGQAVLKSANSSDLTGRGPLA